jgi:hypothetical protein
MIELTSTGLSLQTFEEIHEEIVDAYVEALELTPVQKARLLADARGTIAQLTRIEAEREALVQDVIAGVYDTISLHTTATHLDRSLRLLGMTRTPAINSQLIGTATGTPTAEIPNGSRIQFIDADDLAVGSVWATVEGPYTFDGSGEVEIKVEAEDAGDLTPTLGTDWTILDSIGGAWTEFESESQPVVGAAVEADAAAITRAEVEAFSRPQGPLLAIESNVATELGVTFVRAWDNVTDLTDDDGIPPRAINTVVEGGEDEEIAQAIYRARPAGARLFGLDDGTRVEVVIAEGNGRNITVGYNRVASVDVHIRHTLTTSTSEESAPVGVVDTVSALVLAKAEELFNVGDDVLPWKLEGAIYASGIQGIDRAVVEISLNGSAWQTTKIPITIRQRAAFDIADVSGSED